VDSRSWTDGGEPAGTQDVQRKGAVFLILMLGAVFSFLFLGLGLVLNRVPTPFGMASRAEPMLHYGGAMLWLALACAFVSGLPWAARRMKADAGKSQAFVFLKHFAGEDAHSDPSKQDRP
jgi:hypothetical protein